jgi:hypothetical protein
VVHDDVRARDRPRVGQRAALRPLRHEHEHVGESLRTRTRRSAP